MIPILVLISIAAEPAPAVRIKSRDGVVIVAADLPESAAAALPNGKLDPAVGESRLRFSLLGKDEAPGPAMLGTYERTGSTLTFSPRFPLAPGQRYRATLVLGEKQTAEAEYAVPAEAAAAPRVEAVYPTADEVPANLLKFYIHFSKPMREGPAVFDQVQLLKDDGKPVEDPWRRTELWNEDATRLTLWIHPGRIKQGVNLNEEFGPVLHPGRKYRLVIGTKLMDAEGRPLAEAVTKSFRTTAAVREAIAMENWTYTVPRAGTKAPFALRFPRPLDRAVLERSLRVLDEAGKPVAGRGTVGGAEKSWAFEPLQPWKAGTYTFTVDDRLEDLAGNTPLRPFDLDLQQPSAHKPVLKIPFTLLP